YAIGRTVADCAVAHSIVTLLVYFVVTITAPIEIYTLSLHDALPIFQRNQSAAFSSGKVRPNHETNINIIARRTGKDVNSHTVLDGIITTIMATIQRINIIGSREGSRNRRRLKANQTG